MALSTTMNYVARLDIFNTEKAFSTDFPVSSVPGARRSNHEVEQTTVQVHPIENESQFNIDIHGFCVIKAKTNLDPDQAFANGEEVKRAYWEQIEKILAQKFPEYTRIEGFDFTVRKRDEDFPAVSRLYQDHEQPLRSPHIDWTAKGSKLQLRDSFPGQDHIWLDKDYDIINVWRPLLGPNNDWPLAMCDWTSIDQDEDVLLNDAIRRDKVDENAILHHNPAHRWYYIQDQADDELIVFRNSHSKERLPCQCHFLRIAIYQHESSKLTKDEGCFHSAIYNPQATGPARISIEARMVAFRNLR
ncbi:hypothetical protein NUW58_g1671 [Xylaria curta]|uniref:Uncharacterized protein n=1 Tax=Xylaria curta TaxID=42375 RepID=A0ACC1PJ38_9PEZI|nr:hypothetical protein NUW58_g1671 [Xylaria curta]